MSTPTPEQREQLDRALGILPDRLRAVADGILDTWVGRVLLGFAWGMQRIEIFDRSMAVAAQLFTSVFPMLILMSSWFGNADNVLVSTLDLPPEAATEVDAAMSAGTSTTFGIIGTIIVVASATSLSRALARAFAVIWSLPRPKSSIRSAWRWVAVVVALVLTLVVVRRMGQFTQDLPPPEFWNLALTLGLYIGVALFVPWVLLNGLVSVRGLLPGALIFGVLNAIMRPFTDLWLPRSLEASALRYGSIGVAFTYLAWLYVIAWVFLAAAVLGSVLVNDNGPVGRWLAGGRPLVHTRPRLDAGPAATKDHV